MQPAHLPTPTETLLLRAACLEGEPALAAWQSWLSQVDLQSCGKTSLDLFPAIYRNLASITPDGLPPILHGAYRKSWVQNRIQFARAASVLRLLRSNGIKTLILKGSALVAGTYHDAGARPMSDVDVLVPVESAERAYCLLMHNGWRDLYALGGSFDHITQVTHSSGVVLSDGSTLDLHWHVFGDCCNPCDDAAFWDGAVDLTLADEPTKGLCASDMVLHVMVHGAKWRSTRSIVWAMDAYKVIAQAGQDFDWHRLVAQATNRSVVMPVLDGLHLLQSELGLAVPASALATLGASAVPVLDKLEYRAHGLGDSVLAQAQRDSLSYLKRSRGRPPGQRALGAIWYVQAICGVQDVANLPAEVTRRLHKRARAYLNRLSAPLNRA